MKKYLQLFLAMIMLKPTPIEKTKTEFNYLAFGDSQAAGLGLHGFAPDAIYENPELYFADEIDEDKANPLKDGYYGDGYNFHPAKSYPMLIVEELKKEYDVVNYTPATMSAMRSRDIDMIINDKPGDFYKSGYGWGDVGFIDGYIEDNERYMHNPFLFNNMEDVVDRILQAKDEEEKVNKNLYDIIAALKENPEIEKIKVDQEIALIAVVGRNMVYKPGISAKIFSILGKNEINVKLISQNTSEISIIVGINNNDFNKAINAIYAGLIK